MKPDQIRKRYLDFFEKQGHVIVPSASLVPENDPTTLFTASGMQPMVPYLLGQKHPNGVRIADSQKSFRTVDIDEVGDNRHTTFFEMLGNWSLGDYFKKEQITWMFDFLIEDLGLDPNKLYVTTFIGDDKNNIPKDTESAELWKDLFKSKGIEAKDVEIGSEENVGKVGMQGGRIFYYDAKKNWWSRAGIPENMPSGEPGGPDTEMFYEFTDIEHDVRFGEHCHPNCDCGRFLEIGNNVFMAYKKNADGSFSNLPQKNVDFGGGLERLVMAINNNPDIIEVNHKPIIEYLEKVSGKKYKVNEDETKAFRVIADHMKAATFLISDGVLPANSDRGYFVRRIIRRSVRFADKLGIENSLLGEVVDSIADMYKDSYPELVKKSSEIKQEILKEESKFRETLKEGLRQLEKTKNNTGKITGKDAFDLFSTYGFPFELTKEVAKEKDIIIGDAEISEFEKELKEHQETSRTASAGKFKGGLGDTSEMSVKYHTATHLLHAGLRNVLGEHVFQKGSNITPERLRFDFSHGEKMTDEQIKLVEEWVNDKIKKSLPVNRSEMSYYEAKSLGAMGLFEDKYGDKVSVYSVGNEPSEICSRELCGGPHVENTSVLGKFSIKKEEASSAGIRRIKAILE